MVLLRLWFYNYVRGKGTNGYKKVKYVRLGTGRVRFSRVMSRGI